MTKVAKNCVTKHELKISGHPRHLAEGRAFVAGVARRCRFNETEIFDIKLAVGEALANAIEHGSPRGAQDTITIDCYCNHKDLKITVKDQGTYMGILPNIQNMELDYRGRGILLMLALMDKVSIDELENGTAVSLTKKHHL